MATVESPKTEQQSKGLAIVFAEELYEDLELHYPRLRLVEAGYTVAVVAPIAKQVYKSKFGYWATATHSFADIDPKQVKVFIFFI
jgi:protease I